MIKQGLATQNMNKIGVQKFLSSQALRENRGFAIFQYSASELHRMYEYPTLSSEGRKKGGIFTLSHPWL